MADILEKISGISNLRPVFDFLDKSDRQEVAQVNKAFRSMVLINKDVFKIVRKLSKQEAMETYAREMNALIPTAFDLNSDSEERYTSMRDGNPCPFGNDTTFYVNFRKLVWAKTGDKPRMIEIHINRHKLMGTRVITEGIWVYEKHINKNLKTGKDTGFIIGNLSFVDYSRKNSPSRYYGNYFPKHIKSQYQKDLEKYNKKREKKKARLIV